MGRMLRVPGGPAAVNMAGAATPGRARDALNPAAAHAAPTTAPTPAASWSRWRTAGRARWRRVIEEHGAEANLPYSYAGTMGLVQRNAGHAFFHALGGVAARPDDLRSSE
jgi:hypothetical protein